MSDLIILYLGFGGWTWAMVRWMDDNFAKSPTAKATRMDLLLMAFFLWPLVLFALFGPDIREAIRDKIQQRK